MVLVFVLQHYVPLATFLISTYFTTFDFMVASSNDFDGLWLWIAIFYTIQAILFNGALYKALPGAIRFVDPTWNYVEDGKPLFPNVFYIFGLVSRHPINGGGFEATSMLEDQESGGMEKDDEVATWTL